jgi:hypothetical protein
MILETEEENLTTIAVSRKNHSILSMLGKKGQSFNDVLTELLSVVIEPLQESKDRQDINFVERDQSKKKPSGSNFHGE